MGGLVQKTIIRISAHDVYLIFLRKCVSCLIDVHARGCNFYKVFELPRLRTMRKIYAFIECDTCHLAFGRDDSISPSDADDYEPIIAILEVAAVLSGWHCSRQHHYCNNCVKQAMRSAKFA